MSTHTNTTLFFSRITLTLGTVNNDNPYSQFFQQWFKNRPACVRLSVSADKRKKWESSEKASRQKMAGRERHKRLVLQFPLSSPTPRGFRALFLDPLFLLSRSLEKATDSGIQADISLYVSGKLPTYPSPKPKFSPKWEVGVNVGLGEGRGRWAVSQKRIIIHLVDRGSTKWGMYLITELTSFRRCFISDTYLCLSCWRVSLRSLSFDSRSTITSCCSVRRSLTLLYSWIWSDKLCKQNQNVT